MSFPFIFITKTVLSNELMPWEAVVLYPCKVGKGHKYILMVKGLGDQNPCRLKFSVQIASAIFLTAKSELKSLETKFVCRDFEILPFISMAPDFLRLDSSTGKHCKWGECTWRLTWLPTWW